MKYIYIGDIVNTHGIKGEVRILSDFKYKKDVFKDSFRLYVGREKEELVINSYRHHKIYDMVTFKGINNINDVVMYKGDKVYINKDDLKINGYFDEDIIGLEAYINNSYIGIVKSIMKNKAHGILVIENDKKRHLVPNIDEFIDKIDLNNKKIYIKDIEGLIDED